MVSLSSFSRSGRIFLFSLSCLHAKVIQKKKRKKKKEIDKWGGQDYLASGTNTNTHMIMIMMHSISLVGLTSPHLTSPSRGAGIGGESDAKPLDDGRYTGTGA